MQNKINKATAPCIIGEGTLFNKRDMIRALETVENVTYYDIVDNRMVSSGEGTVLKVFANKENATLILNGVLFINVSSFKYLHFTPDKGGQLIIDLVNDSRTLRLIPAEEKAKSINSRLTKNVLASEEENYSDEEACASILDELMDEDED